MTDSSSPRRPGVDAQAWMGETPEAALQRFDSAWDGLDDARVRERQAEHGSNRIVEEQRSSLTGKVAAQLNSPLIVILGLGVGLSLLVGHWQDAVTIGAIIVLNTVLGVTQEWRAERAVAALRNMLSPVAHVVRDGAARQIPAEELVPGDVVVLERGLRVPADVVVLETSDLLIDESALTGESQPVTKQALSAGSDGADGDAGVLAYAGTLVVHGRARAMVVAIGSETHFGNIATLTETAGDEPTTLQKELRHLARQLGVLALLVGVVIVLAGVLTGRDVDEILLMAVALAIAVVPEGLPAVVTLTLAIGMRVMARRGALLRRLQAAETLGAATIICTDKTGTLTQNIMTAVRIWMPHRELQVEGAGYEPTGDFHANGDTAPADIDAPLEAVLRCAAACNNARLACRDGEWVADGMPTELALLTLARKADVVGDALPPRRAEIGFDSSRKRMSVIIGNDPGEVCTKGAPEVILARCSHYHDRQDVAPMDDALRERAESAYKAFAADGLRVLALAGRRLDDASGDADEPDAEQVERDLVLYGFVGIMDPHRPEVPSAVATAKRAGIQVMMLTGDNAATAESVAHSVGMEPEDALDGAAIDALDDDALTERLRDGVVLSRVAPGHKLRIVQLLQARDEVVAMTGDGVNDAPALKQANVGVAMGERGTEVAREAADIVLADDNFASIISAVSEGRRQYANIRRFVTYMLSSNAGEVVAILCNVMFGGPLILQPVQILWMNLVTDGATAVALGAEPGSKLLMEEAPRKVNQPLLQRRHYLLVGVLGLYIGVATFAIFLWYLNVADNGSVAYAQTMAFTTIIVLEKFNVWNFRSLSEPVYKLGWFSNPWVVVAWLATIALHVAVVYVPFFNTVLHTVPLAMEDWLVVFILALPVYLVPEAVKILRQRKSGD